MTRGLLYRHRVPCSSSRPPLILTEMRTNLLLTILCHLIIGSMEFTVRIDNQHEEGDQCTLENGNQGICKKLPECPLRLKEVQDGKRTTESTGRCGFDNVTEIVCCPPNVAVKIDRRPAETACQQYDKNIRINIQLLSPVLRRHTYVTDGVSAQPGEFPYMVTLVYKTKKPGQNVSPITSTCGGTLISSQHVLTAAHCVNNINGLVPSEVRLGNVDINSNWGAQIIPISNIISHPQYRRSTYYNDVAILELKFKVHISNTVNPICLETKSVTTIDTTPSTHMVVIGWGVTYFDAPRGSDTLMKTPGLSIVKNDVCNKWYREYTFKLPHGIDDTMICAADRSNITMADACRGDSGGPLLLSTESGVSVIGITAFGFSCGTVVPGVYTAIYPFLDWIEEIVWPTTGRNQKDMFPTKMVTNITV